MKRKITSLAVIAFISIAIPGFAQNKPLVHELYPMIGFYAPDRFQNSFTGGIRYAYHFDRNFSLGASIGFAKAGQEYYRKVGLAAPEQGSSTVIYYNGRATRSFLVRSILMYGILGLGVTRQHDESNFTVSVGMGSKLPLWSKTYLRYEFIDHIFTSGQKNTAWTNNNLEFSVGISFFLQ